MKNIHSTNNSILKSMMTDFEIKKALELFSDLDLFLSRYKSCSLFLNDDEDFVSFLEYLEIEENLRLGYLI